MVNFVHKDVMTQDSESVAPCTEISWSLECIIYIICSSLERKIYAADTQHNLLESAYTSITSHKHWLYVKYINRMRCCKILTVSKPLLDFRILRVLMAYILRSSIRAQTCQVIFFPVSKDVYFRYSLTFSLRMVNSSYSL